MRLTVHGKGMEVTPALRGFVERKLAKLDKLFAPDITAQVTLSVQRERHICEVTLSLDGRLVRAEEAAPDMYVSVGLVVDKLERQVRRYKSGQLRRRRESVVEPAAAGASEPALPEGEGAPTVGRTKRFPLKPVTVEEAIWQMELLGHDFFVFRNAETEQINVVYHRQAGDYGLIEPEV